MVMIKKTILVLYFLLVPLLTKSIILQKKATEHLIWFKLTSSTTGGIVNTFINYPSSGFATYFQMRSHLTNSNEGLQKKYFNFYQISSELIRTNTIVCQKSSTWYFCQSINKLLYNKQNNQLQHKQFSNSSLKISQDYKIITMNDGNQLVFYARNKQKEVVEFILTVAISLLLIAFQFLFKQIKYLQSKFFIQMLTVSSIFVYNCSDFVKEAIQNWNDKNYQFWLFLPLSMICYKILETFVQRFISNPIPLTTWLTSILINCLVVYFALELPLFDFLSYAMILGCKMQDKSNQQYLKIHKIKMQRSIGTAYFLLNLTLVFKKLWTFCISLTPIYFIIRVAMLLFFFIFYLYQNLQNQIKQQLISNQFKIKIIQSKNQLIKQLPSLDLSCTIDQECPICYEKIVCRWAKTPCGHVFHDSCLYEWLDKSQTCPIDRRKAISDRYFTIDSKHKLQSNDI